MRHKVIVVTGKDPALIDGGSESYIRAYGRAAIRAGYEPHYFCVSTRSDVEETDFGTIHRARSPFRPFRGLMVAAHERYVVNSVDRFVGQHKGPHLVHTIGPWSGVGVAVARRLRRRGVEAVTAATAFGTYNHETRGKLRGLRTEPMSWMRLQHEWELFWTRVAVDPSERKGYRGSDIVLVNYDSVREIVLRQFGDGISFGKMTYASEAAFLKSESSPGGIPEAIARLEPADSPLLVAVSRHDPRKGLTILIRALAHLQQEGIEFRACLIGGGVLLERHRSLVRRLGLLHRVAVPGRVPDVYPYLEQADVFVLPSLEEGSGSVSLLEAMQAGAAPVVTQVDGLPEDVIDGQSALLVEPNNVAALAAALRRFLTDSTLRRRVAAEAHKQYLKRFSAEAFTLDVRRIYTALGFPSQEPR